MFVRPLYLRQNANDTTGEHSAVFLKQLREGDKRYLRSFQEDFTNRFAALLGFEFSKFAPGVALQILESGRVFANARSLSHQQLETFFTKYDLERINLYSLGVVDYHLIVDLLPLVVKLLFTGKLVIKGLSVQQRAILVALGLQYKTVDQLAEIPLVAKLPPMPGSQILGHFKRALIKINEELKRISKVKILSKIHSEFKNILQVKIASELNLPENKTDLKVVEGEMGDVDEILEEEGEKIKEEEDAKRKELIQGFQQYKIKVQNTCVITNG